MPVSGEYTWSETSESIEVLIPLKGVSPKKVDVFTASTILKVSYSPFLLDLNLHAEIIVDKCKAILKDGILRILLTKPDDKKVLWGQLCYEGTNEEVKRRRQMALREREDRVKQQMEKVATKKMEEERMVFQQHMELERKERQRMDDVKALEKKKAEDAIHETFELKQNEAPCEDTNLHRDANEEVGNSIDDLPPPRTMTRATFRHTPRFFKTPARESALKQEQEFIMKNRANLKKNKLLNHESVEDSNPVWLKTKGDEFKSQGDYMSAINAYSDGLDYDDTALELLVSRASCYLQIRDGVSCINDCLKILQLTKTLDTTNVEIDLKLEKETRISLGMAYCLNKEYQRGMQQFQKARELDQADAIIEECINYLLVLMEASDLKTKADKSFADANFLSAVDLYTQAIEVDPLLITAHINRTACHLAMKNSASCITDSTTALELLSQGRKNKGSNILASLLLPNLTTKRKWTATLLCRRSAANRLNQDLPASLKDLEQASRQAQQDNSIDSTEIEKQMEALQQQIRSLKQ